MAEPQSTKVNKDDTFFGLEINTTTQKKLLFGVITLWLMCAIVLSLWNDTQKQGQIGDMFGAVNALFSGLAFAGIIYTILLQNRQLRMQEEELKLSRAELKLTREELKLTRKEFEQQNSTLLLQRFDNTFFNLLTSHQNITSQIQVTKNYIGSQVFTAFIAVMKDKLVYLYLDKKSKQNEIDEAITQFDLEADKFTTPIHHYLESLASILSFTDRADILDDEIKQQYFSFIISQISEAERTTIFYYLTLDRLTSQGANRLLELEYKYDLFKNLHFELFNVSHVVFTDIWDKQYEEKG